VVHDHQELVEEIIFPASLDTKAQIIDDLKEMKEQLHKQVNRLRELRVRKREEPGKSTKFDFIPF
jgi:elongator complex protein 1